MILNVLERFWDSVVNIRVKTLKLAFYFFLCGIPLKLRQNIVDKIVYQYWSCERVVTPS
jgi:hypothetical protein